MMECIRRNTQWILIGSRSLISPLEAMYFLLVFIFCKELDATPLQLTLLVSAKPMVALMAFYGNIFIKGRPDRLKYYLMTLNVVGCLPCFLFPFVQSPWFFLLGYAVFMTALKAGIPAWAEILKINLPPEDRGQVFAKRADDKLFNYCLCSCYNLSLAGL